MEFTGNGRSAIRTPAVFITTANSLTGSGGVQLCTRDYVTLLQTAGFELCMVRFDTDHRLFTRVLNRIGRHPYRRLMPPNLPQRVSDAIRSTGAYHVFFNLLDFPLLARKLRAEFGNAITLLHLSHGLDSTDMCIAQQAGRSIAGAFAYDNAAANRLGGKLQFEADYRRYLDAALCLSPLDAELERWLGARETRWFPRPVREEPLVSRPANGRAGCVATLDHAPNVLGLSQLFEYMRQEGTSRVEFRLVGGPEKNGSDFSRRFGFVEYLGRLNDAELREETRTWSCFVHPVFAYARGCSTKLAVALAWGLPIATTHPGVRGYVWDESLVPLARDPAELARLIVERSVPSSFPEHARQTARLAARQPTLEQLAAQMRRFIDSL